MVAADEPFTLAHDGTGRKAKVATQLLTRRVKQGISEFYVVEMLEKSWAGVPKDGNRPTSGFTPAAWWWSQVSAFPHPNSGLG